MDVVFEKDKSNTRKKKKLRKRSVVEFDVPLEAVVDMEKVDHKTEKDMDEDVARGVSKHHTKTLSSAVTTSKKSVGK